LDYLEMPEFPALFDNTVWLDPVRRSASALLPCVGQWRIVWTHTSRLESGERPSVGIVFGTGESIAKVASDGEQLTLTIDPEGLDEHGFGLGG
jgi:hypothetical protein